MCIKCRGKSDLTYIGKGEYCYSCLDKERDTTPEEEARLQKIKRNFDEKITAQKESR